MSCSLEFLEYRTMGEVQKPINSECYAPSSEPFRILSSAWQTRRRKTRKKEAGTGDSPETLCANKTLRPTVPGFSWLLKQPAVYFVLMTDTICMWREGAHAKRFSIVFCHTAVWPSLQSVCLDLATGLRVRRNTACTSGGPRCNCAEGVSKSDTM
jgi:hypothetical protein